jgi:hypothetical protein
LKAPYRHVVALAERLTCGHYAPLRFTGIRSGRTDLFIHAKRRCAACVAGSPEAVSPITVEKLEATLRRLDQVLALVEAAHRPQASF